jgi:hypothetical protein
MDKELIINWNDGETYFDHYPASTFKEECKNEKKTMTCEWPEEKPDVLKFNLTVKKNIAICDFEEIENVPNNPKNEEIEKGILKIIFTDDKRNTVDKISWKGKDSADFKEDKKATWNW